MLFNLSLLYLFIYESPFYFFTLKTPFYFFTFLLLNLHSHSHQSNALVLAVGVGKMQRRLQREHLVELNVAGELSRPFVLFVDTRVGREHAELSLLVRIPAADEIEVVASDVVAEGVRISGKHGETFRKVVLGISPDNGAHTLRNRSVQVAVEHAAAYVCARRVLVVFALRHEEHAVAFGADAEHIVSLAEVFVSDAVVERCLQAESILRITIVNAERRYGICGDVVVGGDGGEGSARTVREQAKHVAAEIVIVYAMDASKQMVALVYLPRQARRCERKRYVRSVDAREVLQAVGEYRLVGCQHTYRPQLNG